MKMIVKEIPIRKGNITYNVGSEYPYTEADKKLLWNLIDISDKSTKASKSANPLEVSAEKINVVIPESFNRESIKKEKVIKRRNKK